MAFHVACPITCRRICYCSLGFPQKLRSEKAKGEFLSKVDRLESFLKDPWLVASRVREEECKTVQVVVPKVVVVSAAPPAVGPITPVGPVASGNFGVVGDGLGGGDNAAAEELLSAQTKRAAMQRKAAAASLQAEDYARRFENGDLVGVANEVAGEEQGLSNANVMCRLCYNGENVGSDRARKMLSCKTCSKKYHRSCLKSWAQHRDLFHWSSWTCPSCRICEVCRRTGDPNKLMFCKRCDGAYHCYCQQPPHKNVSSGPYLCPKHTRCHSCGSSVPGNGLSVRWFLGYTCCDACGRLFVKGNYCPVCLKVYRDSESTPMVCCDVCQRWVHCQCDGISDEKYMLFQADGNLQYKCATCRGECYQVRGLEDAVQELWKRKDEAERDLTACLRAAAGLPTQEEIFSISPYSDDEDSGPVGSKNEYGRSLKFSLKGLVDKSPKKSKEYGKKLSNKKFSKKKVFPKMEPRGILDGHGDAQSIGYISGDNKDEDMHSNPIGESDMPSYPIAGSLTDGMCSVNQSGVLKHRFIDEVTAKTDNSMRRAVQSRSNTPHGLESKEDIASKSKITKGPKLVIHLGARNKNLTNSPRSDASNYQRDQELTTSNGSEDLLQHGGTDRRDTTAKLLETKEENIDWSDQRKGSKLRGKDSNLIKIRKLNAEALDANPVCAGDKIADSYRTVSPVKTRVSLGKRCMEGTAATVGTAVDPTAKKGGKVSAKTSAEGTNDDSKGPPSVSHPLQKDSKPLLKLKFKNPYSDNQSSWVPSGEEEKSSVKGQRSKRKRALAFMEKTSAKEEEVSQTYEDSMMSEIMDANWIIQRLGKDAIGKRVEVHQLSNNSWHKGTVTEVFAGTKTVSVALDDGKDKNVDLDKQGIRFLQKKKKR